MSELTFLATLTTAAFCACLGLVVWLFFEKSSLEKINDDLERELDETSDRLAAVLETQSSEVVDLRNYRDKAALEIIKLTEKLEHAESKLETSDMKLVEVEAKLVQAQAAVACYGVRNFPSTIDWSSKNVAELSRFLNTATGQALITRAEHMLAEVAVRNAQDTFHTQHSAGVTKGISDTLFWIKSLASERMLQTLSRPTGDQVDNNTASSDGEAALVEKFSP